MDAFWRIYLDGWLIGMDYQKEWREFVLPVHLNYDDDNDEYSTR